MNLFVYGENVETLKHCKTWGDSLIIFKSCILCIFKKGTIYSVKTGVPRLQFCPCRANFFSDKYICSILRQIHVNPAG